MRNLSGGSEPRLLRRKRGQILVLRCFVVELSDHMLVKLVGNAIVREHGPIDGDELFDEFRMKAMVLVNLRSH